MYVTYRVSGVTPAQRKRLLGCMEQALSQVGSEALKQFMPMGRPDLTPVTDVDRLLMLSRGHVLDAEALLRAGAPYDAITALTRAAGILTAAAMAAQYRQEAAHV